MKNSKKLFRVGLYILAATAMGVFYNACGESFKPASSSLSSKGGDPIVDPPVVDTGTVNVSSLDASISMELADSKKTTITISSVNGFSGVVDLKLATPEIDEVDLRDGLTVSINPSVVTIAKGGIATAELTVVSATTAPSFASHFHIEAYKGGTALLISEGEVNLTVNSIFRFKIMGVGDANWLVGQTGKSVQAIVDGGGTKTFNFVHHVAGIQVLFDNYSAATRIIHSGGAIPHQNTAAPLAASPSAGVVGGTYKPEVIIGTAQSNAKVYLHNDENSGASRTLNFNVDL